MINIFGIKRIPKPTPPYPKADFIGCPYCKQTYAAYRSPLCPHPIQPTRQLGAGDGENAQIALRKSKIKKKRAPRIFELPYYKRQPWENEKRWRAFSLWISLEEERSLAEVGRRLGYSAAKLIERWSSEDNWKLRFDAYLNDQVATEIAAVKKKWKERTKQMLGLIDSGIALLSAEFDARLAAVEQGQSGDMSIENLISKTAELTKLVELLQGRATEHVVHDTPAMQEQKKIRDIVHDIQEAIQKRDLSHPDESAEDRERFIELNIQWAEEDYQIDREVLTQAVLGHITTSQAEN